MDKIEELTTKIKEMLKDSNHMYFLASTEGAKDLYCGRADALKELLRWIKMNNEQD